MCCNTASLKVFFTSLIETNWLIINLDMWVCTKPQITIHNKIRIILTERIYNL